MNEAAKIVSESLLGLDFANVEIGGIVYTIKPPVAKTICKAVRHFSKTNMSGDDLISAINDIPDMSEHLYNGLSCFICDDESLADELSKGSFHEAKEALKVCMSMIDDSVFQCAILMKNVSEMVAKPRQ